MAGESIPHFLPKFAEGPAATGGQVLRVRHDAKAVNRNLTQRQGEFVLLEIP
jgi:hypothetical protein